MGIKIINVYTLQISDANSTIYVSHVDKVICFKTITVTCSLTGNWLNKLSYFRMVEYSAALKKNEGSFGSI